MVTRLCIRSRPDSPGCQKAVRPQTELEQYLELVKKLDYDKQQKFLSLVENTEKE